MRKTLIGGSLLAVFLLLMLPAVAAEQVKIAQSATTTPKLTIGTTYLEAIRQKYKDNPYPQTILITLAIMVLKLIRLGMLLADAIILMIILRIIGGPQNTSAIC